MGRSISWCNNFVAKIIKVDRKQSVRSWENVFFATSNTKNTEFIKLTENSKYCKIQIRLVAFFFDFIFTVFFRE